MDRRDAGVNAARPTILYDADCGFCRWALGWVLRWDRGRRLRPVALQDQEADVLLSEVEPELRMASWHLVDDDGTVCSGGDAAAPLFKLLPGAGPAAAAVTRAPDLVNRAYEAVVRRRSALGRPVSAAAKARADALIAERR
jgi:predicted DCC family thiol-disulfide oxidoreductase YuxK